MPVIVYDIPGRSIVQVADETLVRLAADYPNIKGIKDATADVARPTRIPIFLARTLRSRPERTRQLFHTLPVGMAVFRLPRMLPQNYLAICTKHGQLVTLPKRKRSMNG